MVGTAGKVGGDLGMSGQPERCSRGKREMQAIAVVDLPRDEPALGDSFTRERRGGRLEEERETVEGEGRGIKRTPGGPAVAFVLRQQADPRRWLQAQVVSERRVAVVCWRRWFASGGWERGRWGGGCWGRQGGRTAWRGIRWRLLGLGQAGDGLDGRWAPRTPPCHWWRVPGRNHGGGRERQLLE